MPVRSVVKRADNPSYSLLRLDLEGGKEMMGMRNLFRSRRRTLTTILGFVFAFVVLLTCWALFDGMDHMLEVQFQETDR